MIKLGLSIDDTEEETGANDNAQDDLPPLEEETEGSKMEEVD